MVEVSAMRQGPLDALVGAAKRSAAVELKAAAPRTKFSVRCRPEAITAAGASFGVVPPAAACRAAVAGDRAALWLGPDEWLLLAPEGDGAAIANQLSVALAGTHHSLVDVSHRSAGILVTGAQAAALVNHGCPLDLADTALAVGMCTRTTFAKSGIILWRVEAHTYHVEIERSFAPYVWSMLMEAREEFA